MKVVIGNATLYLDDYKDVLPIIDTTIDACITDPPYGLDFHDEKWDSSIPDWLPEARRIAPLVIFTTAPTTQWDYPKPDWICCWYRTAAQSRNAQGGFNHWTPILVYGKIKFMVDTFYTNGNVTAFANKGIDHPSPKDIAMTCWLIQNATCENMTILDPFMGSGTTGVACAKTNRKFVGVEINPKYFDIACERIEKAYSQLRLGI